MLRLSALGCTAKAMRHVHMLWPDHHPALHPPGPLVMMKDAGYLWFSRRARVVAGRLQAELSRVVSLPQKGNSPSGLRATMDRTLCIAAECKLLQLNLGCGGTRLPGPMLTQGDASKMHGPRQGPCCG